MKILLFAILIINPVYAESCKGLKSCSELYTRLTGHKVDLKNIPQNLTLLEDQTELTKENAKASFERFIHQSGINFWGEIKAENYLNSQRAKSFNEVPVQKVSKNSIPKIKGNNRLVNYVYFANKNYFRNSSEFLKLLSQEQGARILYYENGIVFISDKAANAEKIVKAFIKKDEAQGK